MLKNSAFLSAIEPNIKHIKRLTALVQDNPNFFGTGHSIIQLVTDKLEKLIEAGKLVDREGDMTLCKVCGYSIRYSGVHWQHLSERQQYHPGMPR